MSACAQLEKSKYFYGNILGMNEITRRVFPYKGAWFDIVNGLSLHLIEGKSYETQAASQGNHFAFETKNLFKLEKEWKL
jgi:catechol 2,3-dioxygenase-like lactoylglutathione lyase family enzyme